MPEELTPVIREEEYLAAIAGQDVTPPDPATRKEEWLDAIAGRVDGLVEDVRDLAEDVGDLGDIVPTPEDSDSGKVLTAGADGTASWQTAGGGSGEFLTIYAAGVGTYDGETYEYETNIASSDVIDALADPVTGRITQPVFVCLPDPDDNTPFYSYATSFWFLAKSLETDEYEIGQWIYYVYVDRVNKTVHLFREGK